MIRQYIVSAKTNVESQLNAKSIAEATKKALYTSCLKLMPRPGPVPRAWCDRLRTELKTKHTKASKPVCELRLTFHPYRLWKASNKRAWQPWQSRCAHSSALWGLSAQGHLQSATYRNHQQSNPDLSENEKRKNINIKFRRTHSGSAPIKWTF